MKKKEPHTFQSSFFVKFWLNYERQIHWKRVEVKNSWRNDKVRHFSDSRCQQLDHKLLRSNTLVRNEGSWEFPLILPLIHFYTNTDSNEPGDSQRVQRWDPNTLDPPGNTSAEAHRSTPRQTPRLHASTFASWTQSVPSWCTLTWVQPAVWMCECVCVCVCRRLKVISWAVCCDSQCSCFFRTSI